MGIFILNLCTPTNNNYENAMHEMARYKAHNDNDYRKYCPPAIPFDSILSILLHTRLQQVGFDGCGMEWEVIVAALH